MSFVKYVLSLVFILALAACGGGGGSAGTPSTGTGTGVNAAIAAPILLLELLDEAGAATSAISVNGLTTLKVTLKSAIGAGIPAKIVDVAGDVNQLKFPDGTTALTDSNGVALLKIGRARIDAVGAGNLTVTYAYKGTTDGVAGGIELDYKATNAIGYQLSPLNVTLSELNIGSTALAAFGNRPVSVTASVNGVVATSSPIQVAFSASCGVVEPASVTTDGFGVASTTYTANLVTCSGTNVVVTASAVGAGSKSGTIAVANSTATNVQFVSTTPQLIYLKESVGTTQAKVVFKVVDSSGNPLQNKKLRLILSNTASGVSLDSLGKNTAVDLTSDSQGLVSVAVFSGTVPTSLNVKATLLDDAGGATAIFSNSNLLTVASGRPAQRSLSLALEKLSIEGLNFDGDTSKITLSMADRQGNPVPPGTQVNFVAEAGALLPAVCFVPPVIPATETSPAIPTSSCTVTMRSSGTRPDNGRVSILAYVVGEEDFEDVNGNNIYDSGEQYFDLGRAYRDDNSKGVVPLTLGDGTVVNRSNGIYDTGEFQVPRENLSVCVAGNVECPGDGIWGAADARKQATIIFASGAAIIKGAATPGGINVLISDVKSNSMPTGSTVLATPVDRTSNDLSCSIAGPSSAIIPNTLSAISYGFSFKDCFAGDAVIITVTTPLKTETSANFGIQ